MHLKSQIIQQYLGLLKENLITLQASAAIAKDEATNPESKAEHKYDTRGLEASYLASAQSKRSFELAETIEKCEKIKISSFKEGQPINWTALIELRVNDEKKQFVFALPVSGGLNTTATLPPVDGEIITSITFESPIGKNLLGKKKGHFFEIVIKKFDGSTTNEYEVISVW
jgi:hypothetical protein